MIFQYGKSIIEALLFAAGEPLTIRRVAEAVGLEERAARDLLEDLRREYDASARGLQLIEVAGGYQLCTRPDYAPFVAKLRPEREGSGLTHASLETLAIVAYRQPVTRAEIEAVRGVKVERSLGTLMEKGLIREVGRKEGPGRPIIFGTTKEFLMHFGLKDLGELPDLEQFRLRPESGPAAGDVRPH